LKFKFLPHAQRIQKQQQKAKKAKKNIYFTVLVLINTLLCQPTQSTIIILMYTNQYILINNSDILISDNTY